MSKTLTVEQLRAKAQGIVDKTFGGVQAEAARKWSVGRAYLNLYLSGQRPAGGVATALGYRKEVTVRYRKG